MWTLKRANPHIVSLSENFEGEIERAGPDVHGGEGETDSLTGTSLGDGDHVPTAESHRPGLALDRRRRREVHGEELGEDVRGETGLLESRNGLLDVPSLNDHLVRGLVGVDLGLRSGGDGRVLDVEVLLDGDHVVEIGLTES